MKGVPISSLSLGKKPRRVWLTPFLAWPQGTKRLYSWGSAAWRQDLTGYER